MLSYIELSKKNLIHNLKTFRKIAKRGTKFALAIKGNAYGHGQNEIAKIAEPYADYFILNHQGTYGKIVIVILIPSGAS
jgi:alanine racemase